MASVSDQLDRLYHLTLQSDSDPEFYQNVYEYCHLVLNDPTLSDVLKKQEREYAQKHGDIWDDTSKDSDQKTEEIYRLERFSMVADFAFLQMRIYYPIDDYRSSSGPEGEQDPGRLGLDHPYDKSLQILQAFVVNAELILFSFENWT